MGRIEAKDLSYDYADGFTALHNLNFCIEDGEFVCVVGHSGCGKTTLLRLISGLSPITSGELTLNGKLIEGPGLDRAVVFQQYSLFPWKTAIKNVEYGIRQAHPELSKSEARQSAALALKNVGMGHAADLYPYQLSGGMKQRVGIAMGMTAQPKLLLADEPTSALDVTIQAQVVHEMKELRDRYGTTIILVTHNMGVASYLSDKIGVMCRSHLVEFGSRDEIIYHPKEQYTKDLLEAVPKLGGKRFAR